MKPKSKRIIVAVLISIVAAVISYGIYISYPWFVFFIEMSKNENKKAEYLKLLTAEKRVAAEQVFEFRDKSKTACVFIQDGVMAFSSSNHVLCIYDKKNHLIDKCIYGAHSLIVKNWTNDNIELELGMRRENDKKIQEYNEWYINSWKNRNKKIGRYRIKYFVRFEE